MVKLSSSEEENIEFLSSVWQRYKYFLIAGIFTIGSSILGWEFWSESVNKKYQLASDLYETFIDQVDNSSQDKIKVANEILELFPNTLYADLVTFHLAKIKVEDKNFNEAETYLQAILERHSSRWGQRYDPIKETAKLRLARVLVANNKSKQALEIIGESNQLNASLYEVKGDAYVQLDQIRQAKLSYLLAIESTQHSNIQAIIKMKLSDLEVRD